MRLITLAGRVGGGDGPVCGAPPSEFLGPGAREQGVGGRGGDCLEKEVSSV